jgi:hypothetical protein
MRAQWIVLILDFFCSAGCGTDGRMETAPVAGQVLYNGEPLKMGSLLFVPEGGGPSAQGKIQPDGTYRLGTYTETDGAILGSHKVMITVFDLPGGTFGLPEDAIDASVGLESVIPERYGDLEKSGLRAKVQPGVSTIDFTLESGTP